jgi:hypothetical protein
LAAGTGLALAADPLTGALSIGSTQPQLKLPELYPPFVSLVDADLTLRGLSAGSGIQLNTSTRGISIVNTQRVAPIRSNDDGSYAWYDNLGRDAITVSSSDVTVHAPLILLNSITAPAFQSVTVASPLVIVDPNGEGLLPLAMVPEVGMQIPSLTVAGMVNVTAMLVSGYDSMSHFFVGPTGAHFFRPAVFHGTMTGAGIEALRAAIAESGNAAYWTRDTPLPTGPTGERGQDSTVPGPTGAASTIPGPTGPAPDTSIYATLTGLAAKQNLITTGARLNASLIGNGGVSNTQYGYLAALTAPISAGGFTPWASAWVAVGTSVATTITHNRGGANNLSCTWRGNGWYTFYLNPTYPNWATPNVLTGCNFTGGQWCVANYTFLNSGQVDVQTWRNGSVSNNSFYIVFMF